MADLEWPGTLPTYMEAVRRLTAENQALRTQLDAEQAEHRDELNRLKAAVHEGLTVEMIVTRRELSRWRTRAQAAEARLKQKRRNP